MSRQPREPLKIKKVLAHVLQMNAGFTYSAGTTVQTLRAIVWEVVAGKHVGIGECAYPLERDDPRYPPLSASAGIRLKEELERRGIVSGLLGKSALALEALLPDMPAEYDWDFLVFREGLSIALYDLVGKACGLPVSALLGGKRRSQIPGMPVIHTADPGVMIRRAQAWVGEGYRYLKIKPPYDMEVAVEAIGGIRKAVGPDIGLQVDGNQYYKEMALSEKFIRVMEPFRIDLFEDMLGGSLSQIAELRHRTGVRFMVDHEASWPRVYEVCASGAADVINHHPNNAGGLATALQIAAVAAAAGIPNAIGSSGRFGIQDAAFQSLGAVTGLTRPCEDIGLVPYYSGPTKGEYAMDREPSVVARPYRIAKGVIHVPDEPGLGVEIDQERLRSFCLGTVGFA